MGRTVLELPSSSVRMQKRTRQCRCDDGHWQQHCFADDAAIARKAQMHRPMMLEQRPPWPPRLLKGISFCFREGISMQLFENNPMAPKCRKVRGGKKQGQ